MAAATHLLQHIHRLATSTAVVEPTDRELLRRFTRDGDEQAFAALVHRHGPMVWSACRRTLSCTSDAEDVVQATFLLLARKAATLRDHDAVGSWLFGVAYRLSLRARSEAAVRAAREAQASPRMSHDPIAEISLRETQQLFDEALVRLPEKCRAVVQLCSLEGLTQDEAARRLGCSLSTLKRRLEEGRARLRKQLSRRGLTLSSALLAARVTPSAGASVPAGLTATVLRAAAGGPVAARVARLASQGAPFLAGKLWGAAALVLALVAAIAGTAVLAPLRVTGVPAKEASATASTPPAPADEKPRARVDLFDDPLPDGAVARIGTTRFRHGDFIPSLAFTADGKRVLSYGLDSLYVWDTATGRELRRISAEPGKRFHWAGFSPDGKLAATTQFDIDGFVNPGPITLWDLTTGTKVGALGKAIYSPVCFSPDGRLLAVSSYEQVVEIWDVHARKKLASWRAHECRNNAPSLAFTGDGKVLMTAGRDKTVCFWEAETGKKIRRIQGVVNTHDSLALPADGKRIVSVEHKQSPPNVIGGETPLSRIRILDAANGKVLRQFQTPERKLPFGQVNAVRHVFLSPDGKTVAGVAAEGAVYLWDMDTGKELTRIKAFAPSTLAFMPDGKTMAVATWGHVVHLYDIATGRELPRGWGLRLPARSIGMTPDGRTLATANNESIQLWDCATGKRRQHLEGHEGLVTTVHLSADGRRLFSAGADGTVRAWDMANGKPLAKVALGLGGDYPGVHALACSPDGKRIVVLSHVAQPGTPLRLLDMTTGKIVGQINPGKHSIRGAAFLPAGASLVVWTGDRKARVWDVTTGKSTREVQYTEAIRSRPGPVPVIGQGLEEANFAAAVSPDGRLIAFGTDKDMIAVHELHSGTEICRVEKLPRGVGCLAFSPDGRTLAWGSSADPRGHLLEIATGKERHAFTGHECGIVSLAYSADGKTLVSGGNDTTLLVWDLSVPGSAISAREISARWNDLLGDAPVAYQAVRKLAASPAPVVEFLRQQIKAVAPIDAKRIAELIAALDSDDFQARQRAETELENLGELASPACRKALAGRPSVEAYRRLERLRKKQLAEARNLSAERVRLLRAVEVLERAGTDEARKLLATLAKGAEGALVTEQASAALGWMKR
jgi:RNA polymerase sigma factor (sigma-70 family)